ncbi:MAG: hypothetical protein HOD60_10845 [Candidatus Nitrosopelagicus sp.]|jgi:hypothetical protein|nr:hypothetical protein [Candidatus Nitrosopelagicus sp.]
MVQGGTTDKLRGAFLSKKTRTLSELYKIAQFETEGESKYFISKHRVRSSLNRMKNNGEIKQVDDSKYRRV